MAALLGPFTTPRGRVRAGQPSAAHQRPRSVVLHAELAGPGLHIPAHHLKIRQMVGQGSYGEVFEGDLDDDMGDTARVILKRVKSNVEGAEQMSENEHLLNVYVAKNAPDSCADFMGFTVVKDIRDANDRRITPGKWLLWRYQGLKTLGDYLRRRDCINALAIDMQVSEELAVPTVLMHLLDSAQRLHAAGLVHRDVKPSNIIFCDEDRTFRLIDLGAMADLRTGVNYCPDESILDPYYCPPEQYVLPTDAPDLSKKSRVMSLAISSVLWSKHKPDRFDMYSIGLIMLQLSMPHLRTKSALQGFHASFKRCRYDLKRWRTISSLQPKHTAVLDANNGAGWELAEMLLRPRKVQVLADGHVYFTNEGAQRPSAEQALKSRFVSAAEARSVPPVIINAATASSEESEDDSEFEQETASTGGLFGMFRRFSRRVGRIEDNIVRTAEKAESATTTVTRLRKAVSAGKADERELEKAEGLLAGLTGSLQYLQAEMRATVQGADYAFRRGFEGTAHMTLSESAARQKLLPESSGSASTTSGYVSGDSSASGTESTSTSEVSAGEDDFVAGPAEAAERAASTQTQKQQAGAWGLASVFLLGIKSMGKAAKLTEHIVDKVNEEAHDAMGRYARSNMSTAETEFMAMLNESGVTAGSRWADVQQLCYADRRFFAVAGEQKLVLFREFVQLRQEVDDMRLSDAEKDYMRRLSYRVTKPDSVSWKGLKAAWRNDKTFRAVDKRTAEILFVRHVTKLQMAEAEKRKTEAAEMAFSSMLEALQPPVNAESDWLDVRRAVSLDERATLVPADRQAELFDQHKAEVVAATRLLRAQDASGEGVGGDPEAGGSTVIARALQGEEVNAEGEEEATALRSLRDEQAKLKEEYERMEAKLRHMEARLAERGGTTSALSSLSDSDAPAKPAAGAGTRRVSVAETQRRAAQRVPESNALNGNGRH